MRTHKLFSLVCETSTAKATIICTWRWCWAEGRPSNDQTQTSGNKV